MTETAETDMDNVTLSQPEIIRLVTSDTMQPDITAHELAQLLMLKISIYSDAWDRFTAEQRALVMRNSRAPMPGERGLL